MSVYHIDGASGTGKTTIAEELIRRGYKAVDADEEFGYFADLKTGMPAEKREDNWIWHEEKISKFLSDNQNETVFICGGSMNSGNYKNNFEKSLMLHVDTETLKHRLLSRTNNDYGKHPDELSRQIDWNNKVPQFARENNFTLVDSSGPVDVVVDNILTNLGI